MNSLATLIALAGALLLSLAGNVWQWRHAGVAAARSEDAVAHVVDLNRDMNEDVAAVAARLWECTGESARLATITDRAAAAWRAAQDQLARERDRLAEELSDAYRTPDCARWGDEPVCAGVDRLLDPARRDAH